MSSVWCEMMLVDKGWNFWQESVVPKINIGNSSSLHLKVQSMCTKIGKLQEIASGITDNITYDDIVK